MTTSRWGWALSQLTRRVWFRASLFSLAAVATALVAIVASPWIPSGLSAKVGADAVDNILGIIASSMLAVTTFSLNIMVSAFSAASSNVTPRAATLVAEDKTTQNVLATFLGSFLFALVGIVALSAGAYGERGRLVLMAVTVAVIVLIVVTLLRWIAHLSNLGRVTDITARVEAAAADALRTRKAEPYLGGTKREGPPPARARAAPADSIGYVRHVDVGALAKIAEALGGRIVVEAVPGAFAEPSRPLAWIDAASVDDEAVEAVRACFALGDTRLFDQDPRFGLSVLSEIGSRALSPGVNDPGTAIDVIGRGVRLLALWAEPEEAVEPRHPSVVAPGLAPEDLFEDMFGPLARDGAGNVAVGVRLQKAFRSLAILGDARFAAAARRHSRMALARSEDVLTLDDDRARLREAAGDLGERRSG